MATTAEIDAALTLLRSKRVALAQASDVRARAVIVRDGGAQALQAATAGVVAARDEVATAKTALQALLAQPEV